MTKINNQKIPTVIDLFSGAGGSGLGFKDTGFKILAAVEINPYCAETYEFNLGVKVTQVDIRELKPNDLRNSLGLCKGELDVLVGCPPCQGFSRMRNDKGVNDSRNDLVDSYLEFVEEFMPRFALFENVPGIIRTKHGRIRFERLISGLSKLEYKVIPHEENAANFGVPQIRKRVIVIAGRDSELPPYPEPTHSNTTSDDDLEPYVTVRKAIEGMYPQIKAGENGERNGEYPNHIAPRTGKKVMEFIKKVPHDGGSRMDVPESLWLDCHKNYQGHNDVYGRLRWDTPSNTITTGCTNISKGRFVHPNQDRALSYREAARLQGFPDNFIFRGKNISMQIGNAVPPPLAKAIAEVLFQRLTLA